LLLQALHSFRSVRAPALIQGNIRGKEIYSRIMKRPYEFTFIVRVDTTEDVINETIDQVQGWVTANELGTITKVDRWGRRKMAYEIDRQREGYYVLLLAELDPKQLPELERNLKLSPNVLRYLIVRADD
jgi:small subunit ribosomal protein S6